MNEAGDSAEEQLALAEEELALAHAKAMLDSIIIRALKDLPNDAFSGKLDARHATAPR